MNRQNFTKMQASKRVVRHGLSDVLYIEVEMKA
jgi:hypothetical protein